MSVKTEMQNAIREYIAVPAHIKACASAIAYDLLHGPSWSIVRGGDITQFTEDDFAAYAEDLEGPESEISETYSGPVAEALRQFIDDLPGDLYYESWSGCILNSEPEGYQDEDTGEWIEPDYSDYLQISGEDITQALFGKTIAHEFR